MLQRFFTVLLFSTILLSGCHQNDAIGSAFSHDAKNGLATEEREIPVEQNKIIISGNLSFVTDDLNATETHIRKVVTETKSLISSEENYTSEDRISKSLIVRVPSDIYEIFLAKLSEGVDQYETKNITREDVTESYYDTKARAENKKALETRYRDLLSKAKNVQEIMEIERQLNDLRTVIEMEEGQLQNIDRKVAYATFHIQFYEKQRPAGAYWSQVERGFSNGLHNLASFGIGLVNIWPFFPLIFLLIWGYRRWRKA